jgi:hypothetical protein
VVGNSQKIGALPYIQHNLCFQLDRAANQQIQHQWHVWRYCSFGGRHQPGSALVIFFRNRDAIQLGVDTVGSDFSSW